MPRWVTITDALARAEADGVPSSRVSVIRAINHDPRIGEKEPAPGSNGFRWRVNYNRLRTFLKARPRAGQRARPARPMPTGSTVAAPSVP